MKHDKKSRPKSKGFSSQTATGGDGTVMRSNRQMRAIHGVFASESRPLSPNEALDLAARVLPGVGLATVYRVIKKLQDQGKLESVPLPSQAPRYEVAGKPHHHHFLCQSCDRVFDLQSACKSNFAKLVPEGFSVSAHGLYLEGRCSSCVGIKA